MTKQERKRQADKALKSQRKQFARELDAWFRRKNRLENDILKHTAAQREHEKAYLHEKTIHVRSVKTLRLLRGKVRRLHTLSETLTSEQRLFHGFNSAAAYHAFASVIGLLRIELRSQQVQEKETREEIAAFLQSIRRSAQKKSEAEFSLRDAIADLKAHKKLKPKQVKG